MRLDVVQKWSSRGMVEAWSDLVWWMVREMVDAVRYQPRHLDLVPACRGEAADDPSPFVLWWVQLGSAFIAAGGYPHAIVRAVAIRAGVWLGPTTSTLLRWSSGAAALLADRTGGRAIERSLPARAHPSLLVPHPHEVTIVAVDMRGFSRLTAELDDTQYLSDLIGTYLTALTRIVEAHRGVVFQYTGDGLLAVFLPELAGEAASSMLDRLLRETCRELHHAFDELYAGWRRDWRTSGRPAVPIGLGIGVSHGIATIGFIGPVGKKQIGVLGEPVNLAAYLCSQAPPGEALVDRAALVRLDLVPPPPGRILRLRSRKAHQRIEALRLRYGAPARGAERRWLGAPLAPS
jgi:class 3 adenylate cyclase